VKKPERIAEMKNLHLMLYRGKKDAGGVLFTAAKITQTGPLVTLYADDGSVSLKAIIPKDVKAREVGK
jgi:hypothetical protein